MLALGKKNVFFHPSTWVDFFPSNPAGKVYSNRVKKNKFINQKRKKLGYSFLLTFVIFHSLNLHMLVYYM